MVNIFSITFFLVLILNEYHWYKKRKYWRKGCGTVVSFRDTKLGPGSSFKPVVQWMFDGEVKQFTSNYSVNNFEIGETVDILFAPDGSKAELYNFATRWFVSIASVLFILFSIAIAKA